MEKIEEWLKDNNSGCVDGDGSGWSSGDGSGDGSGYGSGDGSGSGWGWAEGSDWGSGEGDGSGSGWGWADGCGCGDGSGYGFGFCFGDGSGDGCGDGSGIQEFEHKKVHLIDGVQTIIERIKDPFAVGYILHSDFTLEPCWVMKGNGYFAHGKTIKKAREALMEKILANMDSQEVIEKFLKKFKKGEKYPGNDFFEWHHYLTGSCLMGREAFVKNKDLKLDDLYTVEEFISLCENDYGSEIIKKLKEKWKNIEEESYGGNNKVIK